VIWFLPDERSDREPDPLTPLQEPLLLPSKRSLVPTRHRRRREGRWQVPPLLLYQHEMPAQRLAEVLGTPTG